MKSRDCSMEFLKNIDERESFISNNLKREKNERIKI